MEILDVEQVAKLLKVDEWTIYRLAKAGKIPAFKVGRQWRFRKGELEKWMDDQSNLDKKPKLPERGVSLPIEELRQYFKSHPKVVMAFLFGSYAKDRVIRESDVDIAVWLREDYCREDVNAIWRDLENIIGASVDLVVLNSSFATVAWSAMRGISLFIDDYHFYLDLLLAVSGEAEDWQDFTADLWNLRGKYRKAS